MAYLEIANFKYGLDTRRSELTSVPGTLETLNNGHVNQGGELEKRKAFVQTALPHGTGYTFGLEVTSNGLVTFGSVSAATAGMTSPIDAGGGVTVSYQQLVHPDGYGTTTDTTAMTSVVSSTTFDGKAFVIAKYADGKVFVFYDGTVVADFTNGVVLSVLNTNVKIAAALAYWIGQSGTYTASYTPTNDWTYIYGVPGDEYSLSYTKDPTTSSGTLTTTYIADTISPVTAKTAFAQFEIIAGSASAGNNKITSVKVDVVELLSAPVDWTGSNTVTAAAVAANIRANSVVYTAVNHAAIVVVSTIAEYDDKNNFVLSVTTDGNVCVDKFSFELVQKTGTSTVPTLNTVIVDGVDLLGGTGPIVDVSVSAVIATASTYINANSLTHLSYAFGGILYLSRRTTTSSSAAQNVVVTTSVDGGVSGGPTTFLVVVPDTTVTIPLTLAFGGIVGSVVIAAYPAGGTSPYLYQWREVGTNYGGGVWTFGSSSTTAEVSVRAVLTADEYNAGPSSRSYQCTITDARGIIIMSDIITVITTNA